mmetsp:Transcript_26476/g.47069  ORF Transcript_26476/g.47069 Transcript_26476/m.47069 type:complete len:271 (+) Transcript_26476:90-902(+)
MRSGLPSVRTLLCHSGTTGLLLLLSTVTSSCTGFVLTPPQGGLVSTLLSTTTATTTRTTCNTCTQKPVLLQPLFSSYLESLELSGSRSMTFSTDATSPSPATGSGTSLKYIPVLSLHHADTIANKVIECCDRNGFNPVSVYVLDHAGHTLVSKRMDGCSPVGIPDFARAKAFSCIVNKYPSRTFRDRYTTGDVSAKFCQLTGMVAISQGQMAPFPGGILVTDENQVIVGAVGVSGAAGDEDEYCAIRGVVESKFGLSTVPENHSCSTVKD